MGEARDVRRGFREGAMWVVAVLLAVLAPGLSAGTSTLEERLRAQEALDRVAYRHRLWPQGTSRPKPTFDELFPEDVRRRRVEEDLEKSAALDFDGDSLVDPLWYNVSSGKIVQWLMDANVQRTTGRFTNPANAGDANWRVLAGGDYGVGPGGVPGTNDVVWRNASSGKFVVWHLDLAGNRTAGTFTTPDAPANPQEWTIAGPR